MCLVLAVSGVLILSFTVREFISRHTETYFDGMSDFGVYSETDAGGGEIAAADSPAVLYDGTLVYDADPEQGGFYVGTWNGHVAVFNWCGSLCFETNIVASGVTAAIRDTIKNGICFNTIDDARQFLETL